MVKLFLVNIDPTNQNLTLCGQTLAPAACGQPSYGKIIMCKPAIKICIQHCSTIYDQLVKLD